MKTKRSIVVIIVTTLILGGVYYRYFLKIPEARINEGLTRTTNELDLSVSKEVSTIATYTTPGGEDKLRFTLSLNNNGLVVGVKTEDIVNPDKANANLEKFSQNLLIVIKGKRLSELGAVDRVGTSSLTTAAFNKSLSELKSQI